MDIVSMNDLLKENINYKGLGKYGFVELMYNKFRSHRTINDEEFYLDLIECPKCHENEIICEFVGANSEINFGLYFKIKSGQLMAIDFCKYFGDIDDIKKLKRTSR